MKAINQPSELLHVAVCQAVQLLNQGRNGEASSVLRQSLVDYADVVEARVPAPQGDVVSPLPVDEMAQLDYICRECGVQQPADGMCANCGRYTLRKQFLTTQPGTEMPDGAEWTIDDARAVYEAFKGQCMEMNEARLTTALGVALRTLRQEAELPAGCKLGEPMMHGPQPYRWCGTHNRLMLACEQGTEVPAGWPCVTGQHDDCIGAVDNAIEVVFSECPCACHIDANTKEAAERTRNVMRGAMLESDLKSIETEFNDLLLGMYDLSIANAPLSAAYARETADMVGKHVEKCRRIVGRMKTIIDAAISTACPSPSEQAQRAAKALDDAGYIDNEWLWDKYKLDSGAQVSATAAIIEAEFGSNHSPGRPCSVCGDEG